MTRHVAPDPASNASVPLPDIQVREVTRYIVTRYFHPYYADGTAFPGSSEVVGEFDSMYRAEEVAEALTAIAAARGSG